MALDIYLVKSSTDELSRQSWQFGFEEDVFAAILHSPTCVASRFPLISRMRDYYADTDYLPSEVPELGKEVERLKSQLPNERTLQKTLNILRDICDRAAAEGKMLRCIAD